MRDAGLRCKKLQLKHVGGKIDYVGIDPENPGLILQSIADKEIARACDAGSALVLNFGRPTGRILGARMLPAHDGDAAEFRAIALFEIPQFRQAVIAAFAVQKGNGDRFARVMKAQN